MGYPEIHIVAVSDLCVTDAIVRESFGGLVAAGAHLQVIEWKLHDLHDLREKVILTEREGPRAVAYPPELDGAVVDCDVLVTHICPVPRSLMMRAHQLRVIGCARSGLENVDIEAASERNIAVLHCPLSKTSTAADATVGMMLAGCRGLARAHHQMMQGEWDARFAFFGNSLGLTGRKVGLVGFGNIGKAVARRLQGFDVDLMVHDPYQEPGAIRQLGGEPVSLPQLLENADFVVMLARLDKGTKGLIGEKELSMMKPTSFFINTARAGLVDYAALRRVLQKGGIAGAALDVFDIEPLNPDDALLKLENVTLTPHVAGVSKAGYMQAAKDIAEDIRRFCETGTPKFPANSVARSGRS
jgi:D-3-phosphoglycerate dehydrogenase / 2-oxoglutarate reductase